MPLSALDRRFLPAAFEAVFEWLDQTELAEVPDHDQLDIAKCAVQVTPGVLHARAGGDRRRCMKPSISRQ
jgi:hypothetical protein